MGVNSDASQPGYYTLEGNQISTNAISDNYRQALTFIKRLYDERLMDPESFIQKEEQLYQKYTNSRIGAYAAWWNSAGSSLYRNYNFEQINPNAKIIIPDPPIGPAGKQGFAAQDPVTNVIAVNRNIASEVLDAGLRFLDYNLTDKGWKTCAWGLEGLHWSTDDAGKVDHIAVLNREDLNGKTVVPENMEFYSLLIRWDIYPERYFLTDMVSVMNKEALERSIEVPLIRNTFIGISTDEGITYIPDLARYELEMQIKFILGEESLNNWDNYVNKWKSLGGEEVRQSLLREYNAQNGTDYIFLEP
jgi:putative aldouronate transport system substrate-binding protein